MSFLSERLREQLEVTGEAAGERGLIPAEVAYRAIRAAYGKGYQDAFRDTPEQAVRVGWGAVWEANRALAHVSSRRHPETNLSANPGSAVS